MNATKARYKPYYQCKSKQRFSSYQQAERRADSLKWTLGYRLDVYHCEHCSGFHVATPSYSDAGLSPFEYKARRITELSIIYGDETARVLYHKSKRRKRALRRLGHELTEKAGPVW